MTGQVPMSTVKYRRSAHPNFAEKRLKLNMGACAVQVLKTKMAARDEPRSCMYANGTKETMLTCLFPNYKRPLTRHLLVLAKSRERIFRVAAKEQVDAFVVNALATRGDRDRGLSNARKAVVQVSVLAAIECTADAASLE